MAIIRWRYPSETPAIGELSRLQEEMNTLFDRFFGKGSAVSAAGVYPPINMAQDDDHIYLKAELPGMAPGDIDVTIEDDNLILKGNRKTDVAEPDVSYHRRERGAGSFSRTIALPVRVVADKAVAETRNGVLNLVLPKAEEVKPKKIEIKLS